MRLDQLRQRGALAAARLLELFIQRVRGVVIQARDCYISKFSCELVTFGKCRWLCSFGRSSMLMDPTILMMVNSRGWLAINANPLVTLFSISTYMSTSSLFSR